MRLLASPARRACAIRPSGCRAADLVECARTPCTRGPSSSNAWQLYIPNAAVWDATLPIRDAATKKSDAEAPLSLWVSRFRLECEVQTDSCQIVILTSFVVHCCECRRATTKIVVKDDCCGICFVSCEGCCNWHQLRMQQRSPTRHRRNRLCLDWIDV